MARRKKEISLRERVAQWVEAPFRPVAFGLRDLLRKMDFAPAKQLAERCTPKALQRGLASVLVFFVCLWAFFQAVPMLAPVRPAAYAQETPELVNTVSFSTETTMESLEIQWQRGPIEVRPYNGNKIVVNEYAERGLKADEKGTVYLASHNLTIGWVDSLLPAVDTGVGGGLYKRLEVLIPQEQAKALEFVRILSGESDITVTGLTNTISFRVENTVGEITLENIKAPLTVLGSESGNISGRKLDTEELQLKTTSGAVELTRCVLGKADLRSVDGPLLVQGKMLYGTVQTYSAPVQLELTAMPGNVEVTSAKGDVTVTQPKNTPENRVSVYSEYGKAEEVFA